MDESIIFILYHTILHNEHSAHMFPWYTCMVPYSNQHWLLVVEDSTDHVLSYFLKDKSELTTVMLGLIKNLKTKYGIQIRYAK